MNKCRRIDAAGVILFFDHATGLNRALGTSLFHCVAVIVWKPVAGLFAFLVNELFKRIRVTDGEAVFWDHNDLFVLHTHIEVGVVMIETGDVFIISEP